MSGNKSWKIKFLLCLTLIVFLGCKQKQSHKAAKNLEINNTARMDSLFLGFYFGMTREEFFKHSWELNKKQMVTNGQGAEIVRYEEGEKSDLKISFYPVFENDKIVAMPVMYSNTGWAPWNRHLWSDSLIYDIKARLEKERGLVFTENISSEDSSITFSDTVLNQEIKISIKDRSKVLVLYQDLSVVTGE